MDEPDDLYLESFWYPTRDRLEACLKQAFRGPDGALSRMQSELPRAAAVGFEELVVDLISALTRPKPEIKRAAAAFVAEMFATLDHPMVAMPKFVLDESGETISAILSALADPDSEMRIHLLKALRSVVDRGLAAPIIDAVRQHTLDDRHPEVAKLSLEVLMAAGLDAASVVVTDITDLLRHQDAEVRRHACRALAMFETEARCAVPTLAEMAIDPSGKTLQTTAAQALVKIDPTGERLSQRLTDPAAREALLAILRDLGEEGRPLRRNLQERWDAIEERDFQIPPEFKDVWHRFTKTQRALLQTLRLNCTPEGLPLSDVIVHMGWHNYQDPDNNLRAHLSNIRTLLKEVRMEIPFVVDQGRVFWLKKQR